jgi:acetyl-CoA carboxylase biotin carboxyl carrier protein
MPAGRRRARNEVSEAADLARRLGLLLGELGLAEAEVSVGDVRVRVQRAVVAPPPAAPALPSGATPLADPVIVVERPGAMVPLEAPMVGTFYRASGPTAEPYVREGDVVKEGQIVCIIEAMKLMNEIEAKTAGRVAKILVENGQAVEYGQPLFLIEPAR